MINGQIGCHLTEAFAGLTEEHLTMWARIPILGDKPREPLGPQVLSLRELFGPPAERGIEVNERSVKVKEGKALHVANLRRVTR
ncbi:hypothetical protein [Nonomuraea sp. NPDC049400]|uniref:hypothetical protein n=1 Tax=Nonomuraea sp. NPDC049400 TaxID=3364352 RepID=UPI0037A2B04C